MKDLNKAWKGFQDPDGHPNLELIMQKLLNDWQVQLKNVRNAAVK